MMTLRMQLQAGMIQAVSNQPSNIRMQVDALKMKMDLKEKIENWLSKTYYQGHNSNKPGPNNGAGSTFRK